MNSIGYLAPRNVARYFSASILMTFALFAFQACSNANFSGSTEQTSTGTPKDDHAVGEIQACGSVLRRLTTGVKLIFVVDTSGSNTGFYGTDPNRQMRRGSIQAFLNDFGSKPNFSWGFVTFASDTATPLISVNSLPVFSARAADMQDALVAFASVPDDGNTPYHNALDAALTAINNDVGSATDKYIVVFMSDGMPYPEMSDQQLASDVTAIMRAKPNQVTFNAVYYGPGDPEASQRLARMVQLGNGVFLDTNANPNGKNFQITDVVSIPGQSCRR